MYNINIHNKSIWFATYVLLLAIINLNIEIYKSREFNNNEIKI